jgi:hypothetical protein
VHVPAQKEKKKGPCLQRANFWGEEKVRGEIMAGAANVLPSGESHAFSFFEGKALFNLGDPYLRAAIFSPFFRPPFSYFLIHT